MQAFDATTKKRPTIAWFMSIAKPDDVVSRTYADFAKAATMSVKLNAPNLAPYFVYTYLPRQDFEADDDDAFAVWLEKAGTRVVRWRLSFWAALPQKIRSSKQGHINVGAFGRLDVPLIVSKLTEEFQERGLSTDFALYTDADVMFTRDWPQHSAVLKCQNCKRGWPAPSCCRHPLTETDPQVFLAGTEVFAIWGLNSGVMLMNIPSMLSHRDELIAFATKKQWNFLMYDQGLLEEFYRRNSTKGHHEWDSFDDAIYNARGFMNFHDVQLHSDLRPIIWHWHGYKPYDVQCWLDGLISGRVELPGPSVSSEPLPHGGGGLNTMLRSSKSAGCRGSLNPRLALPECSLHLYLRLLSHYYHLLHLAENI